MMHSSTATRSIPSISIRDFNFSARTMEHSRIFANNISSTIEDIRPFIEHPSGITLSSLLNIQRVQNPSSTIHSSTDNFIINVEDPPTSGTHLHDSSDHSNHHYHQTSATDNFLNNIREAANEAVGENRNNNTNIAINYNNNNSNNNNNNNNNNIEENSTETIQISPETRALYKGFQKYIFFISLLFVKGLYDHKASVLNFVVLLVTFNHANNVVKREIAKQHNKSWTSLLVITCYIIACIVFIHFEYDTHIFFSYTQPLTIWELLWSILITDFILKLITIICKVFLTCLPSRFLAFRKKGKYYLMLEATSQLYRCVVPVQPWLYYFFEAYQGPEKIIGVFISVLYIVSKGTDLLSCLKLFQTAACKLFQNMNLGVSPSKEQLIASGGVCAICHEEYSMPVKLHCNHIFCEMCVLTWLNRERSCPLCRAIITDDPIYRDGHTTYSIQLY
ncbi:ring finger protein, transmembrane 2 isoform X2 [Nomia melanderi]|uniref:ring finger protein, transmembrane 2 isoform X2 n=1 Tax=Nomia melanderi TaxID=2448451 RepID=UPI001304364D|nr:E3 ubiquitin-protein ligase RNFT1-like isoform X2 [Nomia melanderi]